MKDPQNIFKFMQNQRICSNNVRHFNMTIYTFNFCFHIISRNQASHSQRSLSINLIWGSNKSNHIQNTKKAFSDFIIDIECNLFFNFFFEK